VDLGGGPQGEGERTLRRDGHGGKRGAAGKLEPQVRLGNLAPVHLETGQARDYGIAESILDAETEAIGRVPERPKRVQLPHLE
jgi:hypothetical protein